MALRCGIIGLPNVGKSTLFNALCQRQALVGNFPFCTVEPNMGVVSVPDSRLTKLFHTVQSAAEIPTTISFVDIAGLVKGASKGEGLGNQFLANIREVEALLHVVRCFDDDDIIHVAGSVDPVFDLEVINHELRLADLGTLKKKQKKQKSTQKAPSREAVLLTQFLEALEQAVDARDVPVSPEDELLVHGWQLLTRKPVIYVVNIDEEAIEKQMNTHVKSLKKALPQHAQVLPICISLEAQIVTLPAEERQAYLEAYGLADTSLHQLIRAAYRLLNLITYFTAGPQEVRAWTVPEGTLAPQAAAVIHSDFEKGFIKAEVIKLDDYFLYQTEEACKQAGKVAIEGKDYTVTDGDVIHFRCNT